MVCGRRISDAAGPRVGHRARSVRGDGGGFTLLEVVLATSVLGVLALSATLVLVPISRQAEMNREVQLANAAVTAILEKIQALPFHEIVVTYPQGAQLPVTTLPGGQAEIRYVDPNADPLEVQVVLSWSSPHLPNMQRTFTTARTE